MCNLATISAGRKGHQVSGGLYLIFHSASSPNDNLNQCQVSFHILSILMMGAIRGPQALSSFRESTDDSWLRLSKISYPQLRDQYLFPEWGGGPVEHINICCNIFLVT